MDLREAFGYLKEHLKTGRRIAEYLGYTENYINSFMCGRVPVPMKTALYIIKMAEELKNGEKDSGKLH